MNKKLVYLGFCCIFVTTLSSITLKQSISEVLKNNPVIQERLNNFRATKEDLKIAESEYYPKLDLRATFGQTEAGNIKNKKDKEYNHQVINDSYGSYETSFTLTQNIFNGFSTMHKVDYEESRILAAAYNYIEKSNDIAFKMTNAYINVLRSNELTKIARENVQINQRIYIKVKDLFDSGLTTNSEVKKIQSALSLAKSNLIVQKNNEIDSGYNYRRLLGRMPEINSMKKPDFEIAMPESIERAAMYSIKHNPSLLVSKYNIQGSQALWKQRKKDYYPRIDLELSQTYNDVEDRNLFDAPDDRFRARILLSYNFFSGGAHTANVQKHVSKINQEIAKKRDLKRQVIEGLNLSWSAYKMIDEQLIYLQEYSTFSEETLELYKEEYDLGKRTLLDLLTAQNDVINSRSQIITAQYELLFSKYRILDAMGLLVVSIVGDTKDFTSKVNLYTDKKTNILDVLPIKLDVDNDNINDDLDLCDNSLKENNIMPYGCKKNKLDNDEDGVDNSIDQCKFTPIGAVVDNNGCALDSDKDGVKDYIDTCPKTPIGHNVNLEGCSISFLIKSDFKNKKFVLTNDLDSEIKIFTKYLNNNKNVNALIISHINETNSVDSNMAIKLTQKRAKILKNELVKRGISKKRLSIEGRGYSEPVSLDDSRSLKNKRFEIELNKISEELK